MPFDPPPIRLGGIAPELVLAGGALLLVMIYALMPGTEGRRSFRDQMLAPAATLIIGGAGWFVWVAGQAASDGRPALHFGGLIAMDGFAAFVKGTLLIFGLIAVWAAKDQLTREGIEEPEMYSLVLFALAGMMLMASATDLIVMFLALETFSIALYVLVGFRRRSAASQEAALKYFMLGAFSSAFFLLGIALAYGASGTTALYGQNGIVGWLQDTASTDVSLMVLASGLLIVGLGFKVAAVPFHMWTPDAYQGAPAAITGFMAAGSKLAGFAAILRLFETSLLPLRWDWRPLITGIAIATMLGGSIMAIAQDNLKRVLAYSSIAHAGFVLIGVVAASDRGISGSLFYLATYGLTVLGAFAIVAAVSGGDETKLRLPDLKGLFFRRPMLAGALTLFLLSLAGVPLTSGFVGKLLVFGAAVESGNVPLVVVGAVASAIAAFFYLRIMVVMYMEEPDAQSSFGEPRTIPTIVIGLTAAATLLFGILWGPLADLAADATFFIGS